MPKVTVQGIGTFEVPEGKRLILALEEDAGMEPLHTCGGKAVCASCRVKFLAGEPKRMTVAEKRALDLYQLSDSDVRLSCQILCEQDMTILPVRRFSGSGRQMNKPAPALGPQPVKWIEKDFARDDV